MPPNCNLRIYSATKDAIVPTTVVQMSATGWNVQNLAPPTKHSDTKIRNSGIIRNDQEDERWNRCREITFRRMTGTEDSRRSLPISRSWKPCSRCNEIWKPCSRCINVWKPWNRRYHVWKPSKVRQPLLRSKPDCC
ncbi:hypothetical protein B9Z55_025512 [Caenorhabditis nigoni]|uniref:Uncharacterized protein n=1 Tax=Caenorhabditis nigoni TaxID=1611254 RepID=A0A2G5SZH9_9PELO|nr:hypothetical protein B9Z55_025512 [Caenorhabditis nigoni]